MAPLWELSEAEKWYLEDAKLGMLQTGYITILGTDLTKLVALIALLPEQTI